MRKGWFKIDGVQDGDRTIDDQLKGLGPALAAARGKTVLDLGCAEGLISHAFIQAGAHSVHGIDSQAESLAVARKTYRDLERYLFEQCNLNDGVPAPGKKREYEIVLALAILHKLRQPFALLAEVCRFNQPELLVIRLPGPVIVDARSDHAPHDVPAFLARRGYVMTREERGHFDEWMGYFQPQKQQAA